MRGYKDNIEKVTLANDFFRNVVYTAKNCQLVVMALKPHEEIGQEIHDVDQFFKFEKGQGKVVIDGNEYEVEDGDAVIVPAGSVHNVINTSLDEDLKLYTLYCPPHHKDGVVHKDKKEAESNDEEFDGRVSE